MVNKAKKIKMPVDAVTAVTYRCNSRCVMCNIWQIKGFAEMLPEAYLQLPKSLKDVNISGGEPFLREDLVEIIKAVTKACPKAKINISTNGFLVDTIKAVLPEIKKICPTVSVSVSVDGIGEMHEKVRRVPNAWPKVVETIHFCREVAKIKHIKLAFTLNNLNYRQLKLAYDWSKRLGVEFTMAIAHDSDIYFGKEHAPFRSEDAYLEKQFKYVIRQLLKSMKPKDWARAYFINGLFRLAKGKERPLKSYAGQDFFYLDPKGDVYPSVVDSAIMGNILDYKTFKELWRSPQAELARADVEGFESNYWMVCTARTAMKRNPLRIAGWLFSKKLRFK